MIIDAVLATREGAPPPALGSFVGGRSIEDAAERLSVVDPSTGREIARVAEAGPAGVAEAYEHARAAFPAWRATPVRDRSALLYQLADRVKAEAERLATLDALDSGNPLTAMRADVTKGSRLIGDAAGVGLQVKGETFPLPGLHYTQREPWGVVGRMVTFNHTVMFTCARLATALIAGNTVIIKPSELAPLGALAVAELTAGLLPDGVVNVVTGGPATGEALVRHPGIGRLSFTGSTATALRIQAAAADSGHVKTLSFELGGKNPIVVFPDVDVGEVAADIVRGMNYTRVQGQSCGSTSRLVIHRDIAEAVLEQVAERAARIRIGPPMDADTEMGTMITAAARDRCVDMVEAAVGAGARVRTGGAAPEDPTLAEGAYLAPTVVDRVSPESRIAEEEIFGPVLAAMTWEREEEALAYANLGRYGLTAAVWTQDIDRALRFIDGLEAGYVWVNDVETRFPAVPFGGWRDSGVGVEHGLEEVLSMTRIRAVNVKVRAARPASS
jgi:acyl-CoA reductase-like NAD-dependent aldehyde dehydrogenase